MTANRRQLLMGGAALVALFVAVSLLWPTSPAPAPTARPSAARSRSARADAQAPPGPVSAVKLKALEQTREGPGDASRNPFRFQPKAPPPAPPRPVAARPPAETVMRPAPPPGPPPAPPIPLKLIGVLTRENGVKWAVLSDGKAGTPMYGKDGDIIDGRYQIVKIGTESIEMTYVDGRGRTVIRLDGR